MSEKSKDISVVARELDAKGVSKTYLSYIPSFVLSRTLDFIALAIDAMLLAHLLGSTALSVDSCLSPLFFWTFLVINLFEGVHIYLSRVFAKNDRHQTNSVFTLTFYFVLIVTAISTVLTLNSVSILCCLDSSLTNTDYLLRLGHRYLLGLTLGIFPMFGQAAFSYMVRIDGSKYLPIFAGVSYVISNIFLDFLLIDKFRYFGAGLATSISYWIGFLILSTHFLKKTSIYKLTKFKLSEVSLKEIFSLSCPNLAYHTAKLLNVTCLTILGFRSFGIVFGTVNNVYDKAHEFTCIAVIGVINAAGPLLGIAYGRKDYKTLREILCAMYKFAFLFIGILCLCLFVFPQSIPLLLNVHPYDEAFAPACKAMQLTATGSMIYAFYYIYLKYYQQTGHEKLASIISLLRPTLFVIPFYYLFSHYDNASGFWWAGIVRDSIALIVLLIFHFYQRRKLKNNYCKNLKQ